MINKLCLLRRKIIIKQPFFMIIFDDYFWSGFKPGTWKHLIRNELAWNIIIIWMSKTKKWEAQICWWLVHIAVSLVIACRTFMKLAEIATFETRAQFFVWQRMNVSVLPCWLFEFIPICDFNGDQNQNQNNSI